MPSALLIPVLQYVFVLFFLPICCHAQQAISGNEIYRESESKHFPPDCRKNTRPAYFVEETEDSHRLVVNIPAQVSRKNLKIDIDYDNGHIEFFGWWFKRKVRGEARRKMCSYHRWILDPDLMSEEAIRSPEVVSVYDIVMSMQDQKLVVSIPTAIKPNSSTMESPSLPPPPSRIPTNDNGNGNEEERIANQTSVVIAYGTSLWKKLRGLARLNDHSLCYSDYSMNVTSLLSSWNEDIGVPSNGLAYLESRQNALERFVTYALGTVDSNW
eukprot:CAMPEP_0201125266 /NCGR_PEP_ID=MMETSP0850-20130426/20363_1 /ASSEMBLY_ACC=CAM_ASM_000622 /TAXON_ID=183588 /ORGANISM="Pseudo-nitzschia fraudulenta, Strain WWA7" /LENGTH=269 /DNA_ID=CAMNT_0047393187 /DNA_START=181 /DNA_END=990 /DNA_ORIENTATION=+